MLMLKIALNYLLTEKKKTLITFLAVSFGISMLVFIAGIFCGPGKFTHENITGLRAYGNLVLFLAVVDSLIISGLAIYNNLSSTINNKMKEITILKITGFTAKDIHNIFLSQGLLLGVAGTMTGLFFGYMLLFFLSEFSFVTTGLFENLSSHFSLLQYLVVFSVGITTTMIAAFMPMKKASGLNPIKTLNS